MKKVDYFDINDISDLSAEALSTIFPGRKISASCMQILKLFDLKGCISVPEIQVAIHRMHDICRTRQTTEALLKTLVSKEYLHGPDPDSGSYAINTDADMGLAIEVPDRKRVVKD